MPRPFILVAALPLGLMAAPCAAQPVILGEDLYVLGAAAEQAPDSARNLFAAGPTVAMAAKAGQDAHLAGFRVRGSGATGGDLYAVGADVVLNGAVGQDLSALGFGVELGPEAAVQGNARLAGESVWIKAPVQGALIASGVMVSLDAAVGGDVWITANQVDFGPQARVAGVLHLTGPDTVGVPEEVVPPDRLVRHEPAPSMRQMPYQGWNRSTDWVPHMERGWDRLGPLGLSAAALLTLAFLLLTGGIFLTAAPALTETLRARAAAAPWRAMAFGVAGLSALVGLVPVAAATLIGLPLVPIAFLALILVWVLGYLLGAYVVAFALLDGLRDQAQPHGWMARLGALALGLLVAALLNFVPIVGWIANLLLGFVGIGAMTLEAARRLSAAPVDAAPLPPRGLP